MGPLTRVIQTGIGLAAELKAASKERKVSEASAEGSTTDVIPGQNKHLQLEDRNDEKSSDDHDAEDDEHFGDGAVRAGYETGLDESEDVPPPYTEEELAEVHDVKYSEPDIQGAKSPGLNCPIVIPQRRPGSKTRGFIRAYAPVLLDHDIDQETFLTFLKSFHKASQASPILNVITVGAGALGTIPEPFSMLAGIGISILSATAAELQGRYRTNSFLDQANEKLFKPRGLYCLVMSYRPEAVPTGDVAMEPVDTSKAALKWLKPPTSSFKMYAGNFKSSSGTTRGEIELPETAPLIYPDTGYAEVGKARTPDPQNSETASKDKEAKRSVFSQNKKVAAAYFDKRAQAKYAYKHPDSALATETPPHFASRHGDPTHPSVTTSYAGRASAAIKGESLADRQARRRAKAMRSRSLGGTVRRLLRPSVLYLMVVNVPTEDQLEEARKATGQSDA